MLLRRQYDHVLTHPPISNQEIHAVIVRKQTWGPRRGNDQKQWKSCFKLNKTGKVKQIFSG